MYGIDMTLLRYGFGEYADDIIKYVTIIMENKNNRGSRKYKEAVDKLMSYYSFGYDGGEDVIEANLALENHLVIKNVKITKECIIALCVSGIVPVPTEDYVKSKKVCDYD